MGTGGGDGEGAHMERPAAGRGSRRVCACVCVCVRVCVCARIGAHREYSRSLARKSTHMARLHTSQSSPSLLYARAGVYPAGRQSREGTKSRKEWEVGRGGGASRARCS